MSDPSNIESKSKGTRDEELWNKDVIIAIKDAIKGEFPQTNVFKGKILKDIFLYKDLKLGYQLQFGFVDQDIVIYDETMDISDFKLVKNIFLHNNKDSREKLIIPKIICELKYNGITSHGLITYSNYAADIKSIFPECAYYLTMRYQKGSSVNKLFRHGKNFNKIIYLDTKSQTEKYLAGKFINDLVTDLELKRRFDELVEEIKNTLRKKETFFAK